VEILPSHHEIAGLGRDKVEAKQVGAPCGDDIVSSSRQDVARSPVWPSPRARAARRYTSPGARVVHAQHRALSSAGATSPIGHFYFSPSGRDITSVRGSVPRFRLCEARHGLPVRRARDRFRPGLAQIRHRLVPHLAPEGVVAEALDLVGHPVGGEPLQRLEDPDVERPPLVAEQALVRHVVGQGMLEGVLHVREQARLVEKFRLPQGPSADRSPSSGSSAIAAKIADGTSLPMTAAVWRSPLVAGGSRSIRAARMACTVAGICTLCTGRTSR
jgi:hypothetical protein